MSEPTPTKQWIMNAFAMFTPGHLAPGQWRHPDDHAGDYTNLEYWTDLAKTLEAGKFHGLFLADHLGIYDVYKGPGNSAPALESGAQFPLGDPFLLVSAMAAATKSLSFAITASTTYENPYALARRLSTLDHITKGRVGWNIVTSYLESAAKAFGLEEQIPHDQRYEKADEYLEVVYKLLESSWKDDSRIKDPTSGKYSLAERVRRIDHHGKYFKCSATHQLHPSIQRTPFILQAGSSSAGKNFASKHSEAMFLPGLEPEKVRKEVDDIRARVISHGRSPDSIKFLAGILVIVDETDEKAQAKYQSYLQYADLEGAAALFGGWTDHDLSKYGEDEDFKFSGSGAIQSMVNTWSTTIPGTDGVKWTRRRVLQELAVGGVHARAIGSPQTVADVLQRWIDVAGIDGFNLSYAISPGGFDDMIKYLWPELRKRGVFWGDYEKVGASMRESYLADGKGPQLRKEHPGASYKWTTE
ncbi:coenzyme dependent N5,N10-methylene tetrahydromethanopterin reductase [Halenospora varia]|nr:coenzyme dependent N5,N10-methylene tetrahydromethanopterin reductase [Halenospora varia]